MADWAPDDIKFEIQKTMPKLNLSTKQKAMLADLAKEVVSNNDKPDGQWFHEMIHKVRENHDLEPKQAFEAVYMVTINKDSGPKAGWFLSILDQEWLVERLKQGSI